MKVVHCPVDTRNPYQQLLLDGLKQIGVSADLCNIEEARRIVFGDSHDRGVLHFHWLPRGFWGPRNFLQFLRVRRLVRNQARQGILIWTAHNLYAHESRNRRRERWLAKAVLAAAHGVIVHSAEGERMVRAEFRPSADKPFAVIPHGNYIGCYPNFVSAAEARRQLNLHPANRVLLFLGTIRPYKGVPEALGAFRDIPDPNARLLVAGLPDSEKTRTMLERMAARDARVILRLGFVPDDALQVYMNAADAVLLPYLNVMTSGAAVLAMSFGRPCIAPRSGCIPEFLSAQPEFLYDPSDEQGLTSAIRHTLQEPQRFSRAGELNLQRAREWDWNRVATETVDFYRKSGAALAPH